MDAIRDRRPDVWVLVGAAALVLVAVAAGWRSALLGLVAALAVASTQLRFAAQAATALLLALALTAASRSLS